MGRSNVKITINKGEDFLRALKRFKRSCERAGIRKELRRTESFEKPSDRKRREERARIRKLRTAFRKRTPKPTARSR